MTDRNPVLFWIRYHPVTFFLAGSSLLVAAVSSLGQDFTLLRYLLISEYREGLPEIRQGQWWRLFTPAMIHFGLLHILFNTLWLLQLGHAIEGLHGIRRMLLLSLVIILLSNLGEYLWTGPLFGGLSGLVYGLLGYIWVLGRFHPASGLQLDKSIALFMLAWFALGWFGLIGNIANMAHTIGLLSGMLIAALFPVSLVPLQHDTD